MKIHIVQKGDTLWEISKKYQVDFEALKQLNSHLASPDMIMPGMKIRIPSNAKAIKQEFDKKKTDKKQVVKSKKEQVKPIEKKPLKKEKMQIPDLPELPVEQPMTLPSLEGEQEKYPTTLFPEIPKAPTKKKEQPKKSAPIKPITQQPKPEQQPQYMMPTEYPCYPPAQTMPAHYPYCYPYYPPIMQPEQMGGCGCCGQQMQPHAYYPYGMQTSPMSQQMQAYTPATQMYPQQYAPNHYHRNEQELYPTPPVQQNDNKAKDDQNK